MKKFLGTAAKAAVVIVLCVCVVAKGYAQDASANVVLPEAPTPDAKILLLAQNSAPANSQDNSQANAGSSSQANSQSSDPGQNGQSSEAQNGQSGEAQSGQEPHNGSYTSDQELKKEEHQRIAGVMPGFNVSYQFNAAPLTPKQKFDLTMHTSLDWFVIATAALAAGRDEASGDFSGYGWGASGYFKRFGAEYANTFDGNLWGNAILPSILHQDPRYFRMGTGTFKKRFLYSMSTTFICRGDNGKKEFNVSNIAGNFIAGGIANVYYPPDDRGFGSTMQAAVTVTAEGMIGAFLDEFWPDIAHKMFKKRAARMSGMSDEDFDTQRNGTAPGPQSTAPPHARTPANR